MRPTSVQLLNDEWFVSVGLASKKVVTPDPSELKFREPVPIEIDSLSSRRDKDRERSHSRGIAQPQHERKNSANKIVSSNSYGIADKLNSSSDKLALFRTGGGAQSNNAQLSSSNNNIYQSDTSYGGIPRPNIVSNQGFSQTLKYGNPTTQDSHSPPIMKNENQPLSLRSASRERILTKETDKDKQKQAKKMASSSNNINYSSDYLRKEANKEKDYSAQLSTNNIDNSNYSSASNPNGIYSDFPHKQLFPLVGDYKLQQIENDAHEYQSSPLYNMNTLEIPPSSVRSHKDIPVYTPVDEMMKKHGVPVLIGYNDPDSKDYKYKDNYESVRNSELTEKNQELIVTIRELTKENTKLKSTIEFYATKANQHDKMKKEKDKLEKEMDEIRSINSNLNDRHTFLRDVMLDLARGFKSLVTDEWNVRFILS